MGYFASDGSYVTDEEARKAKERKEAEERQKLKYYEIAGTNKDPEVLRELGATLTEEKVAKRREEKLAFSEILGRQREEQINFDRPYKEKIKGWVQEGLPRNENGLPKDEEIDEVLSRGMQSYEVLIAYFDKLNDSINNDLHILLMGNLETEEVTKIYNEITRKLNDYVIVLSKLKEADFDLSPANLSLTGIHLWPGEFVDDTLRKVQSRYGRLKMGVPADLSRLYEKAKYQQREGYVNAVLPAFFRELNGQEIYWEGYIILNPGEKTPNELYEERRAAREASLNLKGNDASLISSSSKDITNNNVQEETRRLLEQQLAQLVQISKGLNAVIINLQQQLSKITETQGKKL